MTDWLNRTHIGDCRELLVQMAADGVRVQTCITSPPYFGLRDYGTGTWEGGDAECDHTREREGSLEYVAAQEPVFRDDCGKCGARRIDQQIGLEPSPAEYVEQLVSVFRAVREVLSDDGTVWLNLGDSYAGAKAGNTNGGPTSGLKRDGRPEATASRQCVELAADMSAMQFRKTVPDGLKAKDLIGIPWSVAFALRADGWYLRSDIIWCLSGGASVYARTQKGDMPITIKDLVRLRPETIKLWNGEKWTQVLGWSKSPEPHAGALEIELRSGERIGCTPGHVWPTSRGLVRADELRVGDVIATARLPAPDRAAEPSALGRDVAWLCGLYLAEGSMSGSTVQIAGHALESHERFAKLESVAKAFNGSLHAHTYGNSGTINLEGPMIAAVIRTYIHGDCAQTKGIKVRAWMRDDDWLRALLKGYLAGDAHFDEENDRWRLGFCRNDRLARDLRTLAARLGLSLRLSAMTVTGFGREWPAYRGDIRLTRTTHHNAREDGEVIAIGASRAREFWDIGVEDEPHQFALASGVLTHNSKPNPMPESVTDRPTKAHEYLFLLSKRPTYYYDAAAIAEPCSEKTVWRYPQPDKAARAGITTNGLGASTMRLEPEDGQRNRRTVWTVATQPFSGAHFATFPRALIEPCILAGAAPGAVVLDPFMGSGTTGQVATDLGRSFIGCELNGAYVALHEMRSTTVGMPW